MDWWRVALLVGVALAVVGVIVFHAYELGLDAGERLARSGGRRGGRRGGRASDGPSGDGGSLFDDARSDRPVRALERGLIEAMPEAVIVRRGDGRIVYASDKAADLGVVAGGRVVSSELERITQRFLADRIAREREMALSGRSDAGGPRADGRGVRAGERTVADGRHVRVRVRPLGDDLYVVFLTDVSDRRRFESMRRDFVTNVSHELKTPVGAIALLAETIGDAADDPDAVRYFAGRVAKESERLSALVRRLIDLQKAESMDESVTLAPTSATAVARAAIAENRVQADAHGIAVRLTVGGIDVAAEGDAAPGGDALDEPSDVTVMADREALVMAVKNLVENAIHYSPDHTTVVVVVDRRDDRATIRVIDQGIGIPADKLDRVFERFYRVDPARSRETGGSGLGLSIVRHCVEQCGGTVSVWSHEGSGSTFTIELDAA
ncbi:histidine kinase [Bifidobacterium samirii]|uniref:Sensor-like histidine kinase SenX3 n=2 Tax=Bifidobacterium samirii TaxID=2306974 RepID=A0A430FRC2_9BIFI|nr:histidine kinase [Bifidobacterium samirii]